MKSLMSFVFLMPMLFGAAPLRAAAHDAQPIPAAGRDWLPEEPHIQPYPYPRHCAEGTHRVYDESAGGYVCVKSNDREPRPLLGPDEPFGDCPDHMRPTCGSRNGQMKQLSGILGGDDMASKGQALDGLFDAAQSRKSESGAVSAGTWGPASSRLSMSKPVEFRKGEARLILAGEYGATIGGIAGGVAGESTGIVGAGSVGAGLGAFTGSKVEDKINAAIKEPVDRIGDGLRSDGDSALQKGTQAQKDAEKKYGK